MLCNITRAAQPIAVAVTQTAIAGHLCRRKSLADMQRYFSFSQSLHGKMRIFRALDNVSLPLPTFLDEFGLLRVMALVAQATILVENGRQQIGA
jgi:hypothetical protein